MAEEKVVRTVAKKKTVEQEEDTPSRTPPGNRARGRSEKNMVATQVSTIFYLHAFYLFIARLLNGLVAFYDKLLGLSPKDRAKICRNVSRYYMNKQLPEKAIDSLKEWTRLEPDNPESHFQLAEALTASGKSKQAIIMLNKVLGLNPNNQEALFRKGKLLLKRKEYPEALATLEALLKVAPEDAEVLYLSGLAYSRLEKIEEAIEAMRKAVTLAPEESKYHQHLGFLLEQKGEHKEAAKCFSRVMELEQELDEEEDLD